MTTQDIFRRKWFGYVVAPAAVLAVAAAFKLPVSGINNTTVALAFQLVVLFVAAVWGSRPAVLASLVAVASYNFFYLPPIGTFSIADPHNWIAFVAFLITAITTGELSARVKHRAEEAVTAQKEIERL